jgi:uncharacterized protein (TIGR02145 family)
MIMKRLFTLLAFVVTVTAMSQSVAISDDGSVADGSAILEVKSTTKGFLLPRMDKDQRDAITGAVAGLQIWCTDCVPTAAMYFYTGSEWSNGGTGITSEQATAISDNSKKVGITPEQVDIVDNTSSTNTGDNATNTQYSDQAGLIAGLQSQVVDLQDQIDAMGSETAAVNLLGVKIGDQTWQNTNLNVTTYSDGTVIPQVADPSAWAALKTGAWCYYKNDPANEAAYGKLYNWYAVLGIVTTESATPTTGEIYARKKLAPRGWHIPTGGEWTKLTTFLDKKDPTGNVGGKMKEEGIAHWSNSNTGATNSSGFTGRPGGYRHYNGSFEYIGSNGFFWWYMLQDSSTFKGPLNLSHSNGDVKSWTYHYTNGFSVRLLRD